MECTNHPETPTDRTCYECGKPFCSACYSKVDRRFCCSCYDQLYGKKESDAAREALILALIGLLCLGVVLEPMALIRAIEARREIREHPGMEGWGKTTAAIWIAVIFFGIYLLAMGTFLIEYYR